MSRHFGYLCLWAAGLILVLSPVPTAAADREQQQIMADIRMLQEHTLRLQQLMSTLDQSLQVIAGKMDEQADITRKAFADQRLLTDNMANGVRILREKIDDANVRISSLSQEVEALRIAIPPMPPPLTQLLTDPETGLPIEPAFPAATPVPTRAARGVSPQRMYDTAWADYTNGQWVLALQGFEAYIATFPRSELADDAQFYVGQTHYADGQFEEAVDAFEKVLLSYPDGDAVAEASYKRGLSLDRLGEADRARQAYELVVANHPDSTMATLAQQALHRLASSTR
jgi:tol-pal system protein YbgF